MPDEPIDPAIAAALAEDDEESVLGDLDGEEDPVAEQRVGLDPTPEMAAAAAEVAAEVASGKKPRRGRPPNKPDEILAPPKTVEELKKRGPRTYELATTWNRIAAAMSDRGFGGPENAICLVLKHDLGPTRTRPLNMTSIPGAAIVGDDSMSPGDALQDHITRVYHVATNSGPARWECRFHIRGMAKGGYLGMGEIVLPSHTEIRKMWEAEEQVRGERARGNFTALPRRMPQGGFAGAPGYSQPQPQAAPVLPPLPPMPSPAGGDQQWRFFEYAMQMYQHQVQEAIRLGQQPPPMPQMPVAAASQGVTKEELATTVATAVAQALAALGHTPQGIGGAPATPQPVPTAADVRPRLQGPLEGVRELVSAVKSLKTLRTELREILDDDDDDREPAPEAPVATVVTAPVVVEDEYAVKPIHPMAKFEGDQILLAKQRPDESVTAYATRVAMANPKLSGAVLKFAAARVDQSNFGKLLMRFMEAGGQQAQAAAQMGGQGQVVEAPQQNGGAGGPWRPATD